MGSIQKRSMKLWKELQWLREEAINKLKEEVPNLDIEEVVVLEVGFEMDLDGNNSYLPEELADYVDEGDIILWIHLEILVDGVTLEKMQSLNRMGEITIIEIPENRALGKSGFRISYKTSYNFEVEAQEIDSHSKWALIDSLSGFTNNEDM